MLGQCTRCDRTVNHSKAGNPFRHKRPGSPEWCEPVSDPAPTVEETTTQGDDVSDKGPWFGAMYEGRCSVSECRIEEGDRIRADGQGGYECEDCGGFDDAMDAHVRVSLGHCVPGRCVGCCGCSSMCTDTPCGQPVAAMYSEPTEEAVTDAMPFTDPAPMTIGVTDVGYVAILPTPDEFEDPTATEDVKPVMGVNGQPKEVLRDHMKRYCVVLPGETELEVYKTSGKPVGRTRATTFNKAATDKKNINDWGKRNVVIGASRRRDLLLQAHGLTHEDDRDRLNAIVVELEEAAGSKVGSDLGTYLHEFTEYIDAGLKTYEEAPPEFRESPKLYTLALHAAGLEPIRSLIERTTIIREYGWVCGTFDRIFYHRPSGQYVIGDLKTGKTMDYGKNEVETQLWTYAHGVNQNGIYDWNTRTWLPPGTYGDSVETGPWQVPRVSETVGVVIHMPVQGPQEGTVELLWADLENGRQHAQLCYSVRSQPKGKMRAWGDGPAPVAAPVERDWGTEFRQAMTGERASALWREAKDAGISGVRLNELIELARESIREYASGVDTGS